MYALPLLPSPLSRLYKQSTCSHTNSIRFSARELEVSSHSFFHTSPPFLSSRLRKGECNFIHSKEGAPICVGNLFQNIFFVRSRKVIGRVKAGDLPSNEHFPRREATAHLIDRHLG